jgi:hypothetical protein
MKHPVGIRDSRDRRIRRAAKRNEQRDEGEVVASAIASGPSDHMFDSSSALHGIIMHGQTGQSKVRCCTGPGLAGARWNGTPIATTAVAKRE